MCLVLSYKTGLEAMCNATWLSQTSVICLFSPNWSFLRSCLSQISLHVVDVMAWYSCFSTRPCNHILLLTLLGNKIASNKYTIVGSGMSISRRSYPISIRILDYLDMLFILINKALSKCSFDIIPNAKNSIPMNFTRWVWELTNHTAKEMFGWVIMR